MLVDVDWLAEHLDNAALVVVEVDDQPGLYHRGHIPGAYAVNWRTELQDPVRRDIPNPEAMARLWERLGIAADSTVVFYGDLHNWLAAYGYWLFTLYGLSSVCLLDGGRQHWVTRDLPMSVHIPSPTPPSGQVPIAVLQARYRAGRGDVIRAARHGNLVDVRTPQEYTGQWLTEPEFPGEAAHRRGHIPGALSVPWDRAIDSDGCLKSVEQLRRLYESAGVHTQMPIVTYCRIGERSAHTWIVLHELLSYTQVSNYDGSWTEWGSMTGMPIALGHEPGALPDDWPAPQ